MTTLTTQKNIGGFTLIEVLVTLIILSIGLLGLAGLQGTDIQSNHSAYLRSQAALLSNDMADRMRSNMVGIANGDYDSILSNSGTIIPSCNSAAGCTPAEMAQHDASTWNDAIANLLPSGKGSVTGNGNNSIFTIIVMWKDPLKTRTIVNCEVVNVLQGENCLGINFHL